VPAVIAGLVLATVVTTVVVAAHERRRAEQERQGEASRVASDLRSRFQLSVASLATLQGLFDASEEVTGREFSTFAQRLGPFSSTLLSTRVPAGLRDDFERAPGNSAIRQLEGGNLRRAGARPEYYPVSYRYSSFADFQRRLPLGLDLATDPIRGDALFAARDRGEPQATGPVKLPESGRRGLLLFMPIYAQSVRDRRVRGGRGDPGTTANAGGRLCAGLPRGASRAGFRG